MLQCICLESKILVFLFVDDSAEDKEYEVGLALKGSVKHKLVEIPLSKLEDPLLVRIVHHNKGLKEHVDELIDSLEYLEDEVLAKALDFAK